MTKHFTTTYNHKQNCLRRIKDMIMRLVHFELTHKEYLEIRRKELHGFNSWKRLPIADKEYLRGYEEALISDLYRFDLIWLHYSLDDQGKRIFFHCFEAIPRGKPFYSGHFWAKGRKPFSIDNKITVLP
jgi:hypothetical protein